jgi:hypothetical protein
MYVSSEGVYRLPMGLRVAPWLVLSSYKVYSAGGDNVWIRRPGEY